MKNTLIGWLIVIVTIWNFWEFLVTGSLIALGFGVLMVWLNWNFYVALFYKIKFKYFR